MSREPQTRAERFRQAAIVVLLLPLLPALVAVTLFVLTIDGLRRIAILSLIWATWVPRGKDVLLVYSDSPHWGKAMLEEVLPLMQGRAVVLNVSERNRWPRLNLAAAALGQFHNLKPGVVIFRPLRPSRVFRFWEAFQARKHGHPYLFEKAIADLRRAL